MKLNSLVVLLVQLITKKRSLREALKQSLLWNNSSTNRFACSRVETHKQEAAIQNPLEDYILIHFFGPESDQRMGPGNFQEGSWNFPVPQKAQQIFVELF